MTPAEKRELINELVSEFRSVLLFEIPEDLRTDGDLPPVLLFCHDGVNDSSKSDETLRQVQSWGVEGVDPVSEPVLAYNYTVDGLELHLPGRLGPMWEFADPEATPSIDEILDAVSEATIRTKFAESKANFFESMKNIRAD